MSRLLEKLAKKIAVHLQAELDVGNFGLRFEDKTKLEVLASAWIQRHKRISYIMLSQRWWQPAWFYKFPTSLQHPSANKWMVFVFRNAFLMDKLEQNNEAKVFEVNSSYRELKILMSGSILWFLLLWKNISKEYFQ